jgi:hypothetical protein
MLCFYKIVDVVDLSLRFFLIYCFDFYTFLKFTSVIQQVLIVLISCSAFAKHCLFFLYSISSKLEVVLGCSKSKHVLR